MFSVPAMPTGTTGESPTVTHEEHKRVVEICVEVARGRVPVVAGTGSNSTAEAVDFTRHAKKAGADACLVVAPYYNKPTQEGLFLHYTAIADAVDLPIVLYNVPSRSVVDIAPDTMARLAKHPNIVGVKDATANLARPLHTRRGCGADFIQLTGEDHTAIAFNAAGYQLGVYGNYYTIAWCLEDGIGSFFWQHDWGSRGKVHPRANIHQVAGRQAYIGGVQVDINNVYASDWGQWTPGQASTLTNLTPEDWSAMLQGSSQLSSSLFRR